MAEDQDEAEDQGKDQSIRLRLPALQATVLRKEQEGAAEGQRRVLLQSLLPRFQDVRWQDTDRSLILAGYQVFHILHEVSDQQA